MADQSGASIGTQASQAKRAAERADRSSRDANAKEARTGRVQIERRDRDAASAEGERAGDEERQDHSHGITLRPSTACTRAATESSLPFSGDHSPLVNPLCASC